VGELIACGALSFETALGLTVPQIEFLYESRQRVLASQRASFADDVAAAVIGCLDSDGHKALRKHIGLLRSIADGEPFDDGAASYTGDNVTVL
jgi:hypothetical protein